MRTTHDRVGYVAAALLTFLLATTILVSALMSRGVLFVAALGLYTSSAFMLATSRNPTWPGTRTGTASGLACLLLLAASVFLALLTW